MPKFQDARRPGLTELSENIQLLLQLLSEQKLHRAVVSDVIKSACWWVSDARGKYDACKHWSVGAKAIRQESKVWDSKHKLVHEHVIPKKEITRLLLELDRPTVEQISQVLKISEVCIVSPEEDKVLAREHRQRMPQGWKLGDNIWARYDAVGIKLHITELEQLRS